MSTNQIPVQMDADDVALGVEGGVGVAFAIGAHWSVVGELGGVFANPVSSPASSDGGDPRWDFLPAPPRGFVHLGGGLQYAR